MGNVRKRKRIVAGSIVMIIFLAFYFGRHIASGAACPGENNPGLCTKSEPKAYVCGCSACGGIYAAYGKAVEYSSEADALRGKNYGMQMKTEVIGGNTWHVYYRCYNCGVTKRYTDEIYRVMVDGSNNELPETERTGSASRGPGVVPWWICTVCSQKATGNYTRISHKAQATATPVPTKKPTPTPTPVPVVVTATPTPKPGSYIVMVVDRYFAKSGEKLRDDIRTTEYLQDGAAGAYSALTIDGYKFSNAAVSDTTNWKVYEDFVYGVVKKNVTVTFSYTAVKDDATPTPEAQITSAPPETTPMLTPTLVPTLAPTLTPTLAPTLTPTPTPQPSSGTAIYQGNYYYFTTDQGYTLDAIAKNSQYYVADHTQFAFDTLPESPYTRRKAEYSVGNDANGNTWYFKISGADAVFVHPAVYQGYDACTADVKYITELVFPSELVCGGRTYPVTGIGGGGAAYHIYEFADPGEKVNLAGNTVSRKYYLYQPNTGSYYYYYDYSGTSTEIDYGENIEYCYGVLGNGSITSDGHYYYLYSSTRASNDKEYYQMHYVYNTTLKSITIPDTVTTISKGAFQYCQALVEINGGSRVSVIEESAFPAASELTAKLSEESSEEDTIGNVIDKQIHYYYNLSSAFEEKTTEMLEWEEASELGEHLYFPAENFTELKTIGVSAFAYHTNLKDVTIPISVTQIGERAFWGCLLNSINIENTTAAIGNPGISNYQTLGTNDAGKTRTVIYTGNSGTAFTYGLENRQYYRLHCGYPVYYHPNGGEGERTEDRAELVYRTVDFTKLVKNDFRRSSVPCVAGLDAAGNLWVGGPNALMTKISSGIKDIAKYGNIVYVLNGADTVYMIQRRYVYNVTMNRYVYVYSLLSLGTAVYNKAWFENIAVTEDSPVPQASNINISEDKKYSETDPMSEDRNKCDITILDCNKNIRDMYVTSRWEITEYGAWHDDYVETTESVLYNGVIAKEGTTTITSFRHVATVTTIPSGPYTDTEILIRIVRNGYTRPEEMALPLKKVIQTKNGFVITDGNGVLWQLADGAVSCLYSGKAFQELWVLNTGTEGNVFAAGKAEDGIYILSIKEDDPLISSCNQAFSFSMSLIGSFSLSEGSFLLYFQAAGGEIYAVCLDAGTITYKERVTEEAVAFSEDIRFFLIPDENNGCIYALDKEGYLWSAGSNRTGKLGNPATAGSDACDFLHFTKVSEDVFQRFSVYSSHAAAVSGSGSFYVAGKMPVLAEEPLERFVKWDGAAYADEELYHTTDGIYEYGSGELVAMADNGYDYAIAVRQNLFEKANSYFTGWNTRADGSGTAYYPGQKIALSGTTDLYAMWKAGTYEITFDFNFDYSADGKTAALDAETNWDENTKQVEQDGYYGELPVPSRTGYNFLGWYLSETENNGSGIQVTPSDAVAKPDAHTLYAKWMPNTYMVQYLANGAGGDMAPGEFVYDITDNLAENQFVMSNVFVVYNPNVDYLLTQPVMEKITAEHTVSSGTFLGWALEPMDAVLYEDKAAIRNLTAEYGDVIQLYAKWYCTEVKTPQISRIGYTFEGWNTKAAGDGIFYEAGAKFQPQANTVLYAIWSAQEFTLTFDFNFDYGKYAARGTKTNWTGSTKTIAYDAEYGELPQPERTGYTFAGWYTEESEGNGSGVRITEDDLVQSLVSHTLYARWQPKQYTVLLDGRGATEQLQGEMAVLFETECLPVLVPKKTGYTFGGYYTGTRGSGQKIYDAFGETETVWLDETVTVLYAYWIQDRILLPEEEEQPVPTPLPEEEIVGKVTGGGIRLQVYADDNQPETGAMTDLQPYLACDIVDARGNMVVQGAIPSTEQVCIRASVPAWMLSYRLQRLSGTEMVRIYVEVPYRTQYELEDETLVISEVQTASYHFLVPKTWSYWKVAESGMFYPAELKVSNEAFSDGTVAIEAGEGIKSGIQAPGYRITASADPKAHLSWEEYDSDGMPMSKMVLTEEQYIISDTIGEAPQPESHLKIVCQNAAWQDETQFMVKSDSMELEGIAVLSDEPYPQHGAAADDSGIKAAVEEGRLVVPYTEYSELYRSGICLDEKAGNGRYPSMASMVYTGAEGNIGTESQKETGSLEAGVLTIHTPVVCDGKVDGADEAEITLKEIFNFFKVSIGNYGTHIASLGYGKKDFRYALSGKSNLAEEGELLNQVCFPFDVFLAAGENGTKGDLFFKAGTWITIGASQQMFYIPLTQKEGNYQMLFRSIAVNCPRNGDGELLLPESIGKMQEYANTDSAKYAAFDTAEIIIKGYAGEFAVTRTSDRAVEEKRLAGMKVPPLKTGYFFDFSFVTKGEFYSGAAQAEIKPLYYWVSGDGKTRTACDVYYTEAVAGKLCYDILAGGEEDNKNWHMVRNTDVSLAVPDDVLRYTQEFRKEDGFTGGTAVLHTFGELCLSEKARMFTKYDTSVIPDRYCVTCAMAYCSGEEESCGHGTTAATNAGKNAEIAVQKWYGQFYVPNEVRLIRRDTKTGFCRVCQKTKYVVGQAATCPDCKARLDKMEAFDFVSYRKQALIHGREEFFVSGGYLAVAFVLKVISDNGKEYQYLFDGSEQLLKQWETSAQKKPEDIILYYACRNAGEDFELGGVE